MSDLKAPTDLEIIADYLDEVMRPLLPKCRTEPWGDTVDLHYFPDSAKTDQDEIWLAWIKVEGSILVIHTKTGPVPRIDLADPSCDTQIRNFFEKYLRGYE